MSDAWIGPNPSTYKQNPYVDWWHQTNETPGSDRLFKDIPFARRSWLDSLPMHDQSVRVALEQFGGTAVPIPTQAVGNKLECLPDWYKSDFPIEECDPLPEDVVIVGVIDTGIALGHRRFRRKDGSSRFLAIWQQTAEYDGQDALPCGRELYTKDINLFLCKHSGGQLNGRLDEEAFNRATHLVEPWHELGHRDLDYRAAHGTHVLDLATGLDPNCTDSEKYRIIAVNLPPQYIHGSAGNFLVFFAIFALERIICLADALWRKKHPCVKGGYPLVVNFSYGMQAGAKDGYSPWEIAIANLIKRRDYNTNGAPTRIVMPVGNDNLERGAAVALMGKGKWTASKRTYNLMPEVCLPWRIKPSDQTSNFVEICGIPVSKSQKKNKITQKDFQIFITPPGYSPLPVPPLGPGQHANLGDYARIYCPNPHGDYPLRLIICVAPTLRYGRRLAIAPAGDWEIMVRYIKLDPLDVIFHVQSDQSGTRHSRSGEQAYFDHCAYKIYREDSRTRDSFDYETGKDEEPWNEQGPVQRKGTHNALATQLDVMVVGGYRLTDGRPALYSATMNGDRWRDTGRKVIDGLYPTDDGPAHFGLLAAGSRDGSIVAYRGTSMAAALATREIALQLTTCRTGDVAFDTGCGSSSWLRKKAKKYNDPSSERPKHFLNVAGLKGGAGHLPMPESLTTGRVPRF